MTKKMLIVSHDFSETITNCMVKNKEIRNVTEIICLSDIMGDIEIFDDLTDNSKVVRWYKGNRCISSDDHMILNRVIQVPTFLFRNFADSDKVYARREFEAYLGFAFNVFKGKDNKSTNGLCGNSQSLPEQWQRVREKSGIGVPDYYWGPVFMNPYRKTDRLVYSDIYNFLNWSENTSLHGRDHIFCFKKPPGYPVFVMSIGEKLLVTSESFLSKQETVRIKKSAGKISRIFGCFISEILLFIEDKKIYFGCINAEIVRSIRNSAFDKFVTKHLINEFYKCEN